MSDIPAIKVFLAVAEHRSFVSAARHLMMTPPAVTRAVGALEDQLGVQLLLRTTRQVSLTSAGAAYAARVAPLIAGLAAAAEDLRAEQGQARGLIRINAPMSMGERMLPDVISQFRTLFPQVTLALSLTDRLIDVVAENVDLAIRISGQPKDKLTIWRKIARVTRIFVASPGYLASHDPPVSAEDLTSHCLLAYDADAGPETWDLTNGAKRRRVTAGDALSSNNGDLIAQLAVNGEGIAMLPRFIVTDDLKAGKLQQVLHDWLPPQLWLTLYYPPYERLPMRLVTFSDFFETYVTEAKPV
ncbi:MAG: LysR family transcriptional regulator [bacterium]